MADIKSTLETTHGYQVKAMIATRLNPPPNEEPSPNQGYFTVPEFEQEISGNGTFGKYGVLAVYGHGGDIGIAVEHFANPDDLRSRYAALRELYPADEITAFEWATRSEYVIAVSSTFVKNHARLAGDALVFVYACNSFGNFSRVPVNPDHPENANIVFLDSDVGGVFFIGSVSTIWPDSAQQRYYFRRMLGVMGISETDLTRRNYSAWEAYYGLSNRAELKYKVRSNEAKYESLRLYASPKDIKAKLSQSDIYDWTYADMTYPFTDGDYPGDRSSAAKNPAKPGQIQVALRFSEAMDPSWSGFMVQLTPQSGGTSHIDFTGSWSKNLFDNDTWTGTATIPASGEGWEGPTVLVTKARDAFQDDDSSQNADGELDTDGDGAANGVDTSVRFSINRSAALILKSKILAGGEQDCATVPTSNSPETAPVCLNFIAASAVDPQITAVSLHASDPFTLYKSSSLAENTVSITRELPDGLNYRLVATDDLGAATTAYFHVDGEQPTLTVNRVEISPAEVRYDLHAVDETTGIGCLALVPEGELPTCTVTGTIPGPLSRDESFTVPPGNYTPVARDMGGLIITGQGGGGRYLPEPPLSRPLISKAGPIAAEHPDLASHAGQYDRFGLASMNIPQPYVPVSPHSVWTVESSLPKSGMILHAKYDPAGLGLTEEQQGDIRMLAFNADGSYQDVTGSVSPGTLEVAGSGADVFGYALVIHVDHISPQPDGTAPVTSLELGTGTYRTAVDETYISTATPLTLHGEDVGPWWSMKGLDGTFYLVLDPASPVPAFASSTIAQWTQYLDPFHMPQGSWRLAFASRDHAGNYEAVKSVLLYADGSSPTAELRLPFPSSVDGGGNVVISTSGEIALETYDNVLPASGVETLFYSVDPSAAILAAGLSDDTSAQFSAYSAPFVLSPGTHTLAYAGRDRVWNYGPLQTASISVDSAPPTTSLSFVGEGNEYSDPQGRLFTSASRSLVLESADLAAGLAGTFFVLDPSQELLAGGLGDDTSSQFSLFSDPFPLSNGVHTIAFGGRDRVWNYEPLRTVVIHVDTATPRSELAFSIPPVPAEQGLLIGGGSTITVSAKDPGDPASGIATTYFLLDVDPAACTGPNPTDPRCLDPYYKEPFSLSGGTHAVIFFSRDNVGHLEQPNVQLVAVDTTPPSIAGLSPSGGERFVTGDPGLAISAAVSDDFDPAPAFDLVLVQTLNKGPVGPTTLHVSTGQVIDPIALDDGLWRLTASATDFVMNSTTVSGGEFEVVHDTLPPRTNLTLSGPGALPLSVLEPYYASSTTLLGFQAVDDSVVIGDGLGLGVAYTSYSVNSGSYLPAATFSLVAQGTYTLSYFSADVLGHVEVIRSTTVAIDLTPPHITITSPAQDAKLNTHTPSITITASDPELLPGFPGSGFDPQSVSYAMNGLPYQPGTPLDDGSYELKVTAFDRVGNSASVLSDFLIDTLAPSAAILAPAADSFITAKRPELLGRLADSGSGLDVDGVAMSLDASPVPAAVVHDGSGGGPDGWQSGPSLPTVRYGHGSLEWNGYVYVMYGWTGTGPGPYSRLVLKNRIEADGSLGPWQTQAAQLPLSITDARTVVHNGTIYILGGSDSSKKLNTVMVGKIDPATGDIPSWTVDSAHPLPFPGGVSTMGAVVIGDYIYVMGGENWTCQVFSDVYYARLDPINGGLATGWTKSSRPLPLGLDLFDAVNVDGTLYVYVLGGNAAGCGRDLQDKVYSNKPVSPSGGELGPWQTLADRMPRPVRNHVVLSEAGNVYSIGGINASEQFIREVVFAPVQTNGGLGEWVNDPQYYYPTTIGSTAGVAKNGRLYVFGGSSNYAATSQVYWTRLKQGGVPHVSTLSYVPAADLSEGPHTVSVAGMDEAGNPGSAGASFTVDTLGPVIAITVGGLDAVPGMVSTAADPQIVVSYPDTGSGPDEDTLAIALDDVDITSSTQGQAGRRTFQAVLSQGKHGLSVSVRDNAGNASSKRVDFSVDSIPPVVAIATPASGSFFSTTTIPIAAVYSDLGTGLSTGALKLSLDGSEVAAQLAMTVPSYGNGRPGPWTAGPSLPSVMSAHGSVEWNGYAYVMYGWTGVGPGPYSRLVHKSRIDANGDLGPWQTQAAQLPLSVADARTVVYKGTIYILGGSDSSRKLNTVMKGRIDPATGDIPSWVQDLDPAHQLPFPGGVSTMGAVVIGDYIYVMGGENWTCQVFSDVYFAKLDPDTGDLASGWTKSGRPLPLGLDLFDAVNVDGTLYVYVLGGNAAGCGRDLQDKVYSNAPLSPLGGELGEWRVLADRMPRPVRNHTVLSEAGHVYSVGGIDAGEQYINEVVFAPVVPDGGLGDWINDPSYYYPDAMAAAAGIGTHGRIYVMGGHIGPGALSAVRYAQVSWPEAVNYATATYTAEGLAEGSHEILAQAGDSGGLTAAATASFSIDLTPPVSALAVEASSTTRNGVIYCRRGDMRIQAEDPVSYGVASGVKESWLSIDNGTFVVAASTFSLTDGPHSLSFYSTDKAGNVEAAVSVAVRVEGAVQSPDGNASIVSDVEGLTISTTAPEAVPGAWMAASSQGLAMLTTGYYFITGPEGEVVFSTPAVLRFVIDAAAASTGSISIYRYSGTAWSSAPVHNQVVALLEGTLYEITGEIYSTSFYAVFTAPGAAPPPAVTLGLDLDPDTLNLKSQGRFVTAYLEVAGERSALDIDARTLRIARIDGQALAAPIPPVGEQAGKSGKLKFGAVGGREADGIPDLMVKFDRAALIAVLQPAEQVRVTVEGSFNDGRGLSADALIRTVLPGKVKASGGGGLAHTSKAAVSFPDGALTADTEVTILKLSAVPPAEEGAKDAASSAARVKPVGQAFEFGPEGARFLKPAAIVLPYDPGSLPPGVAEDEVRIAYWDPAARAWEFLPSTVDKQGKAVMARTLHFSQYQAMAPLAAPPAVSAAAAADESFGLGEVYVFPNPAAGGAKPVIHVEVGAADKVSIRIYDIAGDKVHETTLHGTPGIIEGKYAYEYAWDGRIASGVYIYAIDAEKDGRHIRKAGKFAVVR